MAGRQRTIQPPWPRHTTAQQCASMTRPQRPCWKYLCRGLGGPTHLDFKSDWAFRARAYCSENSRARARRLTFCSIPQCLRNYSRARARRLTLRKIGRKFGRCLRANQVANQPAQTADSVRTSLRTSSMRTSRKPRFPWKPGWKLEAGNTCSRSGVSLLQPLLRALQRSALSPSTGLSTRVVNQSRKVRFRC